MESLINVWADLKLRLRRVIGVDCWHIEQYRLLLIVIDIFQYVFVKFGFNFDQLKKNYHNFSKGVLFCNPSPPPPPPPSCSCFFVLNFCETICSKAAMGTGGSIRQCRRKCSPMLVFWRQKKCRRKGFHICGLSFQVLQCCW